jgi:ParB family chromosome partitioning protein
MSEAQHISLEPNRVIVAERLRGVDPDVVDALCAVGLRTDLYPVIVRPLRDNNGEVIAHQLVAGGHRLAAAVQLGLRSIEAIEQPLDDDEARLVEIEENMLRKGLKGLARARFLSEWKRIYEARNPESRNGAHGGRGASRNEKGIFPFSKIAAQKLECDPSTIKKSVALYEGLTEHVREMIDGSWIAEKDSDLRALAALPPDQQTPVLAALLRQAQPATSVKAAVAEVVGAKKTSPEDDQYKSLVQAWMRAGTPARRRFVEMLENTGVAGRI